MDFDIRDRARMFREMLLGDQNAALRDAAGQANFGGYVTNFAPHKALTLIA